jgi:hypothetical protein
LPLVSLEISFLSMWKRLLPQRQDMPRRNFRRTVLLSWQELLPEQTQEPVRHSCHRNRSHTSRCP